MWGNQRRRGAREWPQYAEKNERRPMDRRKYSKKYRRKIPQNHRGRWDDGNAEKKTLKTAVKDAANTGILRSPYENAENAATTVTWVRRRWTLKNRWKETLQIRRSWDRRTKSLKETLQIRRFRDRRTKNTEKNTEKRCKRRRKYGDSEITVRKHWKKRCKYGDSEITVWRTPMGWEKSL